MVAITPKKKMDACSKCNGNELSASDGKIPMPALGEALT